MLESLRLQISGFLGVGDCSRFTLPREGDQVNCADGGSLGGKRKKIEKEM